MTWTLIDTATEGDAELELYAKDAVFMIRAKTVLGGNGRCIEKHSCSGSA